MSGRNTPVAEIPEILALDALNTEERLDYLLHLLLHLPQVPVSTKVYRFHRLKITDDDISRAGSYEGAVVHAIQGIFGEADSYEDGLDVQFREHGEGLEAIVPLIRSGLSGKSKMLVKELRRWIDILLSSAVIHFAVRELPIPPAKRAPKPKRPFDAQLLSSRRSATPSRAGSAAPSRAGSAVPVDEHTRQATQSSAKRAADGEHDGAPAKKAKVGENTSDSAVRAGATDAPLEVDSGEESEPVRALGVGGTRRSTIVIDDDIEMYAADEDGEEGGTTERTVQKSKSTATKSRKATANSSATGAKKKSSSAPKKPVAVAPIFKQGSSSGTAAGKVKPKTTSGTKKRKPTKVVSDNETEVFTSEDESGEGEESDDDDAPPVLSRKELKAAKTDPNQARKWRNNQNDLTDCDEPEPRTVNGKRRGRPPIEIVRTLTIPCRKKSTGKRRYRCSQPNCWESFSSRQKERVLSHHINQCREIDPALRAEAIAVMAGGSLSARLEKLEGEEEENASVVPGPTTGLRQTTLTSAAQAAGKAAVQTRFDFAVMRLFSGKQLPARVLDSKLWKDVVRAANPKLETFSSTTLHDIHIAQEAVHVRQASVKKLKTLDNLTISFDGGTTETVESVWTIHVTTPDTREAHLMAGESASGLSHDGEYIADIVLKVMQEIGEERFVAAVSDSAGAPRKARNALLKRIPTIFGLSDPPHILNLLIKDICGLVYFELVISDSRRLIRSVRLSSFATQRVKSQAQEDGVTRGLESIGNTRFASICRAGHSILRNLTSIKTLVDKSVLFAGSAKERQAFNFLRSLSKYNTYSLTLRQLLALLTPAAKALKCLESSLIHPGHVFLFWLGVIAALQDVIDKNDDSLEIPPDVIMQVTAIVNTRFDAMCEGPENALYKAALFLDPVYVKASFWFKDTAPTAAKRSAAKHSTDDNLREIMPCYAEIGVFLLGLLKTHLAAEKSPFLREFDPRDAADAFRAQYQAYARQESPFKRDTSKGWRRYWKALADNPDSSILAFLANKILSISPSSMAEERTMSAFTKAQDSGRSQMKVLSLVSEVQVKQHYDRLEKVDKRVLPTAKKFRDLPAHARSEVLSGPSDIVTRTTSDGPETSDDPQPSTPAETDGSVDAAALRLNAVFEEVEAHDASELLSAANDAFSVATKINLRSPVLLDLLSDMPGDEEVPAPSEAAPRREKEREKRAPVQINEADFAF
ncbi:hypothetical protein EXIGLDRAFT_698148 [Exidia glandulosa HHB12029]|uniref:DUF659 domain-containing protein n=1 Tax=Exidia glandulosa HHB12029 TaxID=1314781 RepID=A0A165EEM0_EXIGL|nr:hypothetical protein EXIGLDRAFT_698148 [Exidia glandulosa HHB12029]